MLKMTELCKEGNRLSTPSTSAAPPPLSSQYERPEKAMAVVRHKSRFILSNRKCIIIINMHTLQRMYTFVIKLFNIIVDI